MNPLAVTFLLVLTLSFAIFLLSMRVVPASKSTRQRIVAIQDAFHLLPTGDTSELAALVQRDYAARLGAFLERFRFAKRLKLLLVYADSRMSVGGAAIAAATCAAVLGATAHLLSGVLLVGAIAAPIGAALPYLWLRIHGTRRTKAFNNALPDAIDLLARALRAGHSVGSAIEMVGEQSPQPVAGEFVQVFQQQRLGLPFRDTLLQMGERVPSRDLHFLITAILIQKETGGDLTEILDRTAHVIRERVRIEGEVRTKTAQGRLTGWILAMLPVVMLALINLANPGYSDILFHDPQGRQLLYLGAGLILVGGLIIRKIVDVKV
jgi:tight adherence protein B